MNEDKRDIEGIVLPLFGVDTSGGVEWGEWSESYMMCMFAPLKIVDKQYVIVQDELDGFPDSSNENWLKNWKDTFPMEEISLPFELVHPVKPIKPDPNVQNEFLVALEATQAATNYYLLFVK